MFTYSVVVEAEDEKDAEDFGIRQYKEIMPTVEEMGICVEEFGAEND